MKHLHHYCLALILALPAMSLAAQFAYQGQLKQSGAPYTGTAEMTFSLWTAAEGGTQVGSTINQSVPVSSGLFQAELDFGNTFGSDPRWLQIGIDGLTLNPRQRLMPTPVALYALSAPGGSGSNWTLSGNQLSYAGPVSIGLDPEETNLSISGALHAETNSVFADPAISGIAAAGGIGVRGIGSTGISGESRDSGSGVQGTSANLNGSGVRGSNSAGGRGVQGVSINGGFGVLGIASGNAATGIEGRGLGTSSVGVRGEGVLIGVEGDADIYGLSGTGATAGLIAYGPNLGVYAYSENIAIAGFAEGTDAMGIYINGVQGSANYLERPLGIGIADPEAMLHIEDSTGISNHPYLLISDGASNKFSVYPDFILFEPGMLGSSLYLNNFIAGGQTSVCKQTGTGNAQVGFLARCSSSARYKKDIDDYANASELVSHLRTVSYRWIAGGEADLGLVAEEVADIEPRLVTYNEDGIVEGVKYDRLAAVLVRAFQEQQALNQETVAKLNEHNRALQAEIVTIRSETETRLALLEDLLLGSGLTLSPSR